MTSRGNEMKYFVQDSTFLYGLDVSVKIKNREIAQELKNQRNVAQEGKRNSKKKNRDRRLGADTSVNIRCAYTYMYIYINR